MHAASDAASAPLDWRLYVPERWDQRCAGDPAAAVRRKRCAIPWHHHATLVTAAHLFITTLRLTNPKASGQGKLLYSIVRKLQRALAHWIITCPLCHHTFPT